MANVYFAQVDGDTVVNVVVIDSAYKSRGADYLANELGLGGKWLETSEKIRGRRASVGDYYDEANDKFIERKPYPSWILDRGKWIAPNPMPTDGKVYEWNEDNFSWIEVSN